ncbi:DUF4293 family protein, partial [Halomonas marinisediminis]
MIQRIQSLYLLLASICSVGLIQVFDLWANEAGNTYYALSLLNENNLILKIIPIL